MGALKGVAQDFIPPHHSQKLHEAVSIHPVLLAAELGFRVWGLGFI